MSDPKHATMVDYDPQPDGSVIIDTKSYFETLASHKQERALRIKSTRTSLLADLMGVVGLIMDNKTNELTIHIQVDPFKGIYNITNRYTVFKESFNKRG